MSHKKAVFKLNGPFSAKFICMAQFFTDLCGFKLHVNSCAVAGFATWHRKAVYKLHGPFCVYSICTAHFVYCCMVSKMALKGCLLATWPLLYLFYLRGTFCILLHDSLRGIERLFVSYVTLFRMRQTTWRHLRVTKRNFSEVLNFQFLVSPRPH